ncbi:LLM class flavin-dependent oxidoreductase [Asticcacaulis machinosus]|uniref:LLM class flavin-dependent oxidoreductase n=1 Tax=Asticcacaulis machinosus TaxID=2984211 RepID=A0ABT5HJD1_9CAUL|nr:LLM class flavin-dependent oxidoreductase [Asticcacaulis machinosus]MDC7676271.1 LLM class flavin-dependent oxidoreductase [Asticcacaulis machinosus]
MSIDFFWRLPTHGCSTSVRNPSLTRGDWVPLTEGNQAPGLYDGRPDGSTYIDHVAQIAKAAEISGFHGGLIPSFPMTDDPWVISSHLARETKTFRFMIAFQPGFINPVETARLTASLQRATAGRALFNIITGGGGPAQLWWGDSFAHDDRYGRTTEFLDILKGVWKEGPYSQNGKFYSVENGQLPAALAATDLPEIYFSGSSDAALQSASKHADYYLSWLEPFEQLKAKFGAVKEKTDALGRKIKCSVRVDLIARPTEEEAWADAKAGFEATAHKRSDSFKQASDSVGAARQAAFKASDAKHYDELIIGPNLWTGFSLLRGGPALGIVGSYEQCAQKLDELIALGTDSFILAGTPHLEEAYRVGEEVLPLVRGRQASLSIAAE